jgi:hypothetical protein
MKKPVLRRESELVYELPASLTRAIGRVLVAWAHLEYQIQRTIWMLLGIDERQARVAVRQPRLTERMDMIVDLAGLRGIAVNAEDVKNMKESLTELSRHRDLLAHGLWTQDTDGKWCVIRSQGTWKKEFDAPHKNKSIAPEGIEADAAMINAIFTEIEKRIEDAHKIRRSLRATLQS